jgi:hypothetical protein
MKKVILLLLSFTGLMVNGQAIKEISSDWTSFTRSIEVESKSKKKFKVEASVKLVTDDKLAWAGVWARVDNKDDKNGFFDNMGDRPIRSNTWQSYTVEGNIDADSKTLNFGGICEFNGQFFFDNFKLFIENDKGVLELVELPNSSFEQQITDNIIPKWNHGVSKVKNTKVKEFAITLNNDKVDGKYSLLLEGKGIKSKKTREIMPVEGASPLIGSMISMLENLKDRVESRVKNMSQYEIDYLHDEKANRIGSLIMHLAAAEVLYQVLTFENREFNEEEKAKWQVALDLDKGGRDEFKGHEIKYYLDIFNEVRAKTITELKKRDDAWFAEINKASGSGMNNHFCWFHVMEHQSSHLGQILFLKKRIPEEVKPLPKQELKLKKTVSN